MKRRNINDQNKHRGARPAATSEQAMLTALFDEQLAPQQRTDTVVGLSGLVTKIAIHIVCHVLVDYQEQLRGDERLSVAHAFLQRVTTTHICNHKLTDEGLVFEFDGKPFQLHEAYKTMSLTRSVYEHLAMFFFLFEHPKTDEERDIVWKYWQVNSKKSMLGPSVDSNHPATGEQRSVLQEIETLRGEMLTSAIGQQCHQKLDEWTRPEVRPDICGIEVVSSKGRCDVRRVPYSQAWKYLSASKNMTQLYRHLSMHCHPVYDGLLQYQDQTMADEGRDAIPLLLSTSFLAYLCILFLKQLPDGQRLLNPDFSDHELRLFRALAQLVRE